MLLTTTKYSQRIKIITKEVRKMSEAQLKKAIVIDPFCQPQFDITSGKTFIDYDMALFEKKINETYAGNGGDGCLKDGYAPFCKHLFVKNFAGTLSPTLKITEDNSHLLTSEYSSRTEKELPVLVRYFPKAEVESFLKPAEYFDVILYSGEQIAKENEAMGTKRQSDSAWGVVSIKPQDVNTELPMQPITMMRNALGKEEGGSGVSLSREEYNKSVAYWKDHASVLNK